MKEKPLVSIIIPVYNVSAYLNACVESACSQTYTNVEIILVDDGSPDNCPAMCDAWKERDNRIKVIHKINGGLSDARNAGLNTAAGKYVYFLDGDDAIKPTLIETVLPYMEDGNDMVVFHYDEKREDGSTKPIIYHTMGIFNINEQNERKSFILSQLLTGKIGWEAWSRIYSREIIERYHLRFEDNKRIFAEDLYFGLCYCAHVRKITSIASSLYYYTIRESSIMRQDKSKVNVGRMVELAKAVQYHFQQWDDCKLLLDCFPVVFYLIVSHPLTAVLGYTHESRKAFPLKVYDNIQDVDYFNSQISKLHNFSKEISVTYTPSEWARNRNMLCYLKGKNYFVFRIKNRLINRFFWALDITSPRSREILNQLVKMRKHKHCIFLLGTEEYGNIGDNQINESVFTFLQNQFSDESICEVTAKEWPEYRFFLRLFIRKTDLIVYPGGGNLGDLYPSAENIRREIIQLWPGIPKIIFPQTIFFSDTETGKKSLEIARSMYTKENNVVLFVRDQASFAFAKKFFSCDTYSSPDIVLSHGGIESKSREDIAVICLRQDAEKELPSGTEKEIERICQRINLKVIQTDLQLDYHVKKSQRKEIIKDKLDLWCQAKIVITDRLHGMIFAAITATPCIALNNNNQKVKGTFDWIQYLPYIRFAESIEDVERMVAELSTMKSCSFDNTPLMPYFSTLAKVVKKHANH